MKGFTLLEMLIAIAVAAILTSASLNVYAMFQRGIVGSATRYGLFAAGKINELQCRTRYVRGLSPCKDGSLVDVKIRF